MSRSKWKGFYITSCLKKKKKLKIWSRNSAVPFFLIGKHVHIHNGKSFKKFYVSREKVGYKFGSFFFTRILKKTVQKKIKNKKILKQNVIKKPVIKKKLVKKV